MVTDVISPPLVRGEGIFVSGSMLKSAPMVTVVSSSTGAKSVENLDTEHMFTVELPLTKMTGMIKETIMTTIMTGMIKRVVNETIDKVEMVGMQLLLNVNC